MSGSPTPTEEQNEVLDFFGKGKSFKISAFAGTGKTSTLKMLAETYSKTKCSYLAFNRLIAQEASSKFPKNVSCKTFHSLAYHSVPKHISIRVHSQRYMPEDIAHDFRLYPIELPLKSDPTRTGVMSGWDQGVLISKAVDNFCRSSDKSVKFSHVMQALPKWVFREKCRDYALILTPLVQKFWEMCISEKYDFKISHDVYLKFWSLQNPIIHADTIFLDEAQDADAIMLNILKSQDAQIVLVGDKYQQIYQFRGAINAMQSVNIPEFYLTKSFRFGNQIAEIANAVLGRVLGERKKIVGNELIDSKIEYIPRPNAILARTNATAFEVALGCAQASIKTKIEVDTNQILSLLEDCDRLNNGEKLSVRSPFFGFKSWKEVELYVEMNEYADFAPFVRLVQKNDIETLKTTLQRMTTQDDYECVVLTAHKSKGLEYNSVKLMDDFKYSLEPDEEFVQPDEARLIYVAGTRAIQTLDINEMSGFYDQIT